MAWATAALPRATSVGDFGQLPASALPSCPDPIPQTATFRAEEPPAPPHARLVLGLVVAGGAGPGVTRE